MKNILPYAYQHVYERAADCGVIFYDNFDRLVYYTTAAVKARSRGIVVAAASIMYTHTHKSLLANDYSALEQYENDSLSSFARAYNYRYGRTGQLFDRHFGHAQKTKPKAIVQNLAYVYNNHVEKGLCSSAMENRWSLLAYAFSDHPFSKPIEKKSASRVLLRYLGVVDRQNSKNEPMPYWKLILMFSNLDSDEQEQLTDYIISKYALIDFQRSFSRFDSPEAMVNVLRQFSGSEYDISEVYCRESDLAYRQMIAVLKQRELDLNVFTLTLEQKNQLGQMLHIYTDATEYQIKAFLHM